MKTSLAWLVLTLGTLGTALGAACSSTNDGGGASSGGPAGDAGLTGDGSSGGSDGALTDALASQDSASDAPSDGGSDADATVTPGTFTLTSTAFAANGAIPVVHTCDGTNVSPPLTWTDAPAGTKSYAVVVRDLSLGGDNYHWVIYDIPAATTSLPQAVQNVAAPPVPAGAKQTYWSFGAQYGYGGPCPPAGTTHDYQFTVYSFATATIAAGAPATAPAAQDVIIQNDKTGSATLTGKYTR